MAAGSGIVMGFETMETEFMNTVEKAMHYVRRMNSPYLGVYPDSGNIIEPFHHILNGDIMPRPLQLLNNAAGRF